MRVSEVRVNRKASLVGGKSYNLAKGTGTFHQPASTWEYKGATHFFKKGTFRHAPAILFSGPRMTNIAECAVVALILIISSEHLS
jgi:hypothetical protein